LGPSTIVGSASYNLLVISAVCMYSLEEKKKVEQLGVFIITSIASVWAYVWLLLVLNVISPDVVELWEAVLTFLYFPILVALAYGQDVNWCRKPADELPDQEMGDSRRSTKPTPDLLMQDKVASEIKRARLGGETPSADTIGRLAGKDSRPRLNRGYYRINAIRAIMAKQAVIRDAPLPPPTPRTTQEDDPRFAHSPGVVEFASPNYSVMESQGPVEIRLMRRRGRQGRIEVKYSTQDLTAQDKVHYKAKTGTVVFEDGEVGPKAVHIDIIDNDVENDDMTFMCRIQGPKDRVGGGCLAIVRIIDDDHPGEIEFEAEQVECAESDGKVLVHVLRHKGVTGNLEVSYETEDGLGDDAAKSTVDYTPQKGTLSFAQGEHTKTIEIPIVDDFEYEKNEHFFVRLTKLEGKGTLGKIRKLRVNIYENPQTQALYDGAKKRAAEDANVHAKIETHTWLEQFRGAMTIESEDGEPPSAFALAMHFLTFIWKVIFAFVPPTEYGGGWWCFGISLFFIGCIVYIVAELAMLFGCAVGLAAPITAITFVALGTSLPDTFASKTACEQEPTADAAIGNVTGSNSVNVFLGLGLPWLVASIYYESQGKCYIIPAGSLAFSVLVFTICAVIALCTLFGLRVTTGAELGGSKNLRIAVSSLMLFLWFMYILLSSLHERVSPLTGKKEGYFAFPGTEPRCPCSCPADQLRDILPIACLGKCGL